MGPDDYKSSPSGRVPKWVVDEAHGRPVDVVPFRSHGPVDAKSRPSRPGRARPAWKTWLTAAVAIGLVGSVAFFSRGSSPGSPIGLVRQTRTAPPLGNEESKDPLGAPPAAAASSSYRFSHHQAGSQEPVTWSPCRPIHYVVRPEHAPAEGPQLIANAAALMQQATGLRLVDDGTTTEAPSEDREIYQPDRYGDRWAPVLITWATADEVPDFGVDIAGEAGPVGLGTSSGDSTYVSGTVALDAAKLTDGLRRGDAAGPQAVVLHEFGHLLGLAHVNDPTQLMFPRSSSTSALAAGDLAGLARLGGGSCQPDV